MTHTKYNKCRSLPRLMRCGGSIVVAVLVFMLASCSPRTSALNDLRSLTNDIRNYGAEYTVKDWTKVKNEFDKINERLAHYDYTPAQREEIGDLKGQCVKYFAKGVVTNAAGKIIGISSEIKGILQGLKK